MCPSLEENLSKDKPSVLVDFGFIDIYRTSNPFVTFSVPQNHNRAWLQQPHAYKVCPAAAPKPLPAF